MSYLRIGMCLRKRLWQQLVTGLKLHQVPDEEVLLALDVPDLHVLCHVADAGNIQLD
jgi:hypothetical protein